MTDTMQPRRPRFSIVVAVHNVARYLEQFFASLEAQSYGIKSLDILLVNDGSTDDSAEMCESFAAKYPTAVRVLHKKNGGQGSARNLGIEHARGEWVGFADPDDMLDTRYFDAITHFLKKDPDAAPALISTPIILYNETTGVTAKNNPLFFKYAPGNRIADLRIEPENIQLSASTAFFRTDSVNATGLRFDERVRPTFEDAHFVARYLVDAEEPTIALIKSARYLFRRRADRSSTTDTSQGLDARYIDVPKHGYLDALNYARTRLGHVPLWLQYTIVYELATTFRMDVGVVSSTGGLAPEVKETFHELVGEALSHVSREAFDGFAGAPVSDDIRFALARGYSTTPDPATHARIADYDRARGLVLLQYRFTGEQPLEAVYVDSRPVQFAHEKTRRIEFFGRTLARERSLWVPVGKQIRLHLNGAPAIFGADVHRVDPRFGERVLEQQYREELELQPEPFRNPKQSLRRRAIQWLRAELNGEALRTRGIALLVHSRFVRRRFSDAWVFMDRDTKAGDNGEAFYRYVAAEQPHINAWYVIDRSSPDWKRLRGEGVRTIAYKSLRWTLLMLSAEFLISSHADTKVLTALDAARFGTPNWRFVFLQHGVIKDDLSRWLNTKKMDIFVTTTPAEYASIAGDETHYKFSSKEVVLTGLPRHDQLLAKRAALPAAEHKLLLVMPTWRRDVVGSATTSSNKLSVNEEFSRSDYAKRYTALLSSEPLHALAAETGAEIVFMPHPMMDPYLAEFAVPPGVRVLGYGDIDVQQVLARAALLITDYSSMAFDTAVLGVPTVYYQYDRAEIYSGSHNYRLGYFDYEAHGFGPVCDTLAQVELAVAELLPLDSPERAVYTERMQDTFAHHDGRNSARVYEAIRELRRKATPTVITPDGAVGGLEAAAETVESSAAA